MNKSNKTGKERELFDLDKAVGEWGRSLRRGGALEDGAIAELEGHVRDEIDDLIGQGKSLEDAFREVTESVESADVIGYEYYKTVSRGLLPVPPYRSGGFSPALFLNSLSIRSSII